MSVDYDGVGGIGISLTEERIQKLIEHNIFTQEEYNDGSYEAIEKLNLIYSCAGDSYCEQTYFYLFVEGGTLKEVMDNYLSFTDQWEKLSGENLSFNDLIVISDIYVH
jgi:hypothetical protein